MRLLNVHDLSLRNFQPANLPKYAVTSHRWVEDEASMQDLRLGLDLRKSGHRKVKGFADYVRHNVEGISWIWMDTCCINQDSSQEVSEAINSMFKWYRNAEVCLAYLADVDSAESMEAFEKSIWFTRGWTLQELLAPDLVIFLTCEWDLIGRTGGDGDFYSSRGVELRTGPSLASNISAVTRIPANVVVDYAKSQGMDVDAKLRWINGRQATKEEDLAYCLLGICGVTMAIIYGEGHEKARKRLLHEVEASSSEPHNPRPSTLGRCVSVPCSTVATYTDRDALSQELTQALRQTNRSRHLRHAVSLVGEQGSGKTQLVLHYIDTHRNEYDSIIWLDTSSQAAMSSSVERACRELSLPLEEGPRQGKIKDEAARRDLFRWLRDRGQNQPWLVVIDAADDPLLDTSITVPQGPAGSVITTCRKAAFARRLLPNGILLRVGAMTTSEGVSLVSRFLDVNDAENGRWRQLAEQLVVSVHSVPSAIDLVASRIRAEGDEGLDVEEFMKRCLENAEQCQDQTGDTHGGLIGPSSFLLLQLLALFHEQTVQDELLRLAAVHLKGVATRLSVDVPHWLRSLLCLGVDGTWDDSHYRATLKPLLRWGLVLPITGMWPGMKLHDLVQWRVGIKDEFGEVWQTFFLVILAAGFQLRAHEFDARFRRHLMAHVPTEAELMRWRPDGGEPLAWACLIIGKLMLDEGRYRESGQFCEIAHREYERVRGEEDEHSLEAASFLATAYQWQDMWAQSEALRMRSVDICTRTLGKDHYETLTTKGFLVSVLRKRGRFDEAVEVGRTALAAMRRTLGDSHPETLAAMNNLAMTYSAQGRWKDAEKLYSKTVKVSTRVMGADHSETLISRGNLNSLLRKQGRRDEAIKLQQDVVQGATRSLGMDHPDTIRALNQLESFRRYSLDPDEGAISDDAVSLDSGHDGKDGETTESGFVQASCSGTCPEAQDCGSRTTSRSSVNVKKGTRKAEDPGPWAKRLRGNVR